MDNLDTDTEDDSVTITDTTSDISDLTNSHYQGVMLLQKLQQLKVMNGKTYIFMSGERFRDYFVLFSGLAGCSGGVVDGGAEEADPPQDGGVGHHREGRGGQHGG